MKFSTFLACLAFASMTFSAEAQTRRHTCEGEFGTGSGLAGSYVGDECRLAADSDQERAVQKACRQNSRCRVVADVRPRGEFLMVEKVIRAQQTVAAPAGPGPLERLGNRIDGVLAPLPGGCDVAREPNQRVSILLKGPRTIGPTVQLLDRYCAVHGVEGASASDEPLNAKLQLRCGAEADEPALRRLRGGSRVEVTLRQESGGPLTIDGTPYARCPIKRASTPAWWIDRQPIFQGRTLD